MQNYAESKPIDTREQLAKQAGVSHDTISKTEKILEKGNDETKKERNKIRETLLIVDENSQKDTKMILSFR